MQEKALRDEKDMIDRAYTIARIEWMLENYSALLSRKPLDLDKDVRPGATSRHTQWWTSQAYWRKVDRKSDLDKAIEWIARQGNNRGKLLIDLRFRGDPRDRPTWEEVAAVMATSRSQLARIYARTIGDITWYLCGKRDS